MTRPLVDRFDRQVRDLRISITDRCNFRCTYCMPDEGMVWQPRDELLTYEEIERVARICVERWAFTGIRITGGEPTVRADLPVLVEKLSALGPASGAGAGGRGIELALTTNGASLRLLAADLRRAGLTRITVSCDSLQPERFASITNRTALHRVLDGIDAAIEAGLSPVKVNCVLMRGVNDDEIVDFAAWGRARGVVVRFIEFMPLDAQGAWTPETVVTYEEIVRTIDAVFPLAPVAQRGSQPAERFAYRDGGGEVGVIASVTRNFCASCDRVRLTADGQFRNCLFAVRETDLRAILRNGGSDDDLAAAMEADVGRKWAGHTIGQVTFVRPKRSMSQIGG